MGRHLPLLVVAFVVAASALQAQTSTADGVAAFVQGDYERALGILKPMAERAPGQGEPTALFIMGILYENGLGVPRDSVRACALLTQAAGAGPFGHQAAVLFMALQSSFSADDRDRCMLLARLGFDHRFEPATFTFDVGHSIDFQFGPKGVVTTLTYQGREKRIDEGIPPPGTVFLPIRQTDLAAQPAPRHFIERPMWIAKGPGTWALFWNVVEIVGDKFGGGASVELMTIVADRPPGDIPDIRNMAQVRLTDSGQAEWVVTTGPELRSELIESIAEREEMKEESRRRRELEASVDWTRRRDGSRPPELAPADADGCGNVFVFAWTPDRMEVISIRADKGALGLSTTPQTFSLAQHPGRLELKAHVFSSPQRNWRFCSDSRVLPEPAEESWIATSGTVTIELSPPGIRVRSPHLYRAIIRITDAEFVGPSGTRLRQTRPIVLTAIVGGGGG